MQMEQEGDHEGLRRYTFGAYIRYLRNAPPDPLTQQQTAALAGITRQEWNRIENGRHLPRPSNIPAIADVFGLDPAILFRKAGYAVPKEFEHYDMRQAQRDLDVALRNSETLVAFLVEMQLIWQEFQQSHTGKKQRLVLDIAYAEVLATVLDRFSVAQQLRLACELLEGVSPRAAARYGINNQRFFDYLDKATTELRKQVKDEHPPPNENKG
jgi:transcriptional regulator with XRE-family HTH domain